MKYYKYTEEEQMALKTILGQMSVKGYEQAKMLVMAGNIVSQKKPIDESEEEDKTEKEES